MSRETQLNDLHSKLKELLKSHLQNTCPIGGYDRVRKVTVTIDADDGTVAIAFPINGNEVEDADKT